MVETTTQIETHIETTRERLGANLDVLERKIKSATDWREYVQSSPMTLLGAAFAGGVVLAMTTSARHDRRGERVVRSTGSALRPRGPHVEEVVAMLDNIKGALIGMAAMKMKDLVGQVVPGFQQEFDRRQRAVAATAPASMSAPAQ
jgi:hypothetical protein